MRYGNAEIRYGRTGTAKSWYERIRKAAEMTAGETPRSGKQKTNYKKRGERKMKNIKARLTFTDGILGTSPANKDISRDFIGSKAPVPAA